MPVQTLATAARVLARVGQRSRTAVLNSAKAPIEKVVSRTATIQAMRAPGRATTPGSHSSRTMSANRRATKIADQRMYRLATKLNAAARCATPTKYVMKRRAGSHFGTNVTKVVASVKCSPDRKSTRLNSSHSSISYAVFCLKKKTHSTTDKCLHAHVFACQACL